MIVGISIPWTRWRIAVVVLGNNTQRATWSMIYVKEDYKLIVVVGGSGTVSQRRIFMEECELLSTRESLHLCNPVSPALAFHLLDPGIISG